MHSCLAVPLLLILVVPVVAQTHGAVIASDYITSAAVGRIDLDAPWTVTPDLEPVYNDARGRWHDGLVYILNRAGADNLQILDPEQDYATIEQFSLGLGRNVGDIAFLDDGTAYVSCYDTTELLHVDLAGGAILHVISTAAFADADGLPETGWLHRDGDRLFVTCERLDRDNWYSPVGDSYVLVMDVATREWIDCDPVTSGVQGIRLAASNPYCRPVVDGDRLLLGCVGFYGMQDGGVAVIDMTDLVSLGLEIDEAALGGDLACVASGPAGRRHVVVSDANFTTAVKAYTVGGAVTVVHQGVGFDHADIAYDGDFELFVADRRPGDAGVRVFDAASGAQLTSGPLATGMAPSSFILPPHGTETAVPDGLPVAAVTMAAPWPNPANPVTNVALVAPAGSVIELRVIDLRGRLVRRARVTAGADGRVAWTFDGRDGRGRNVASGVYRCVAQTRSGFAARSLTMIR